MSNASSRSKGKRGRAMCEVVKGKLSRVIKEGQTFRLKAHTEINGHKSLSEYTL